MIKRLFDAIYRRLINPIIVYQMGKVGSKTIEASLLHYFEQRNLTIQVYHTHNLIDLDKMERNILSDKNRPNPQATISQIRKDARLRAIIDENPNQRWNLISLVRDPVAQNVGAFFHNMKEFIPDWKEQSESGSLDFENLQRVFLTQYQHKNAQSWFERQMQPMWDIDVYAKRFDHKAGFSIYKSRKANLMVIRLEDVNKCAAHAFRKFLNFKNFQLVNKNVGDEKEYSALYSEFKTYPLPLDFVDDMYNTRFAKHFYSMNEIEAFKKHWLKQK